MDASGRLGASGASRYLELIATSRHPDDPGLGHPAPGPGGASRARKEIELRRALREVRTAIDRYKLAVDQGQIGGTDVKLGSEGYPPDLETLVKGVNQVGATDRKLKFLRRVPSIP